MDATETHKEPRLPLVEQVIRFLVWFSIVGCIATPVVVMLMVYGRVFNSYSVGLRPSFDQMSVDNPVRPKPKIVTGVLDEERARQIARLQSLTGRPEQSSGTVTSLQIIAVAFDHIKPSAAPQQSVDDDGYRSLSLNLERAPHDAAVIRADQPIRWRLQGLAPGSPPRVGFEGYAAFDVRDGQPGSLAGFRIGAFGATGFARAVDPTDGEVSIRQTFCASLQNWIDLFGLPLDAVRFTLLLNPSQIAPNQDSTESDGAIIKTMNATDLHRLCRPGTRR
jgi:hypothetical protein